MPKRELKFQQQNFAYTTPKFQNGQLPKKYEMFKGPIPTLNHLVTKVSPEGEIDREIEITTPITHYDCMEAYQKALPGQGFARLLFERKNEDGTTTLVDILIPAFNHNDGKIAHREHLKKLGIPYVESNEKRGKATGTIHVAAAIIFGFDWKSARLGIRLGGGIFKGKESLTDSQSQNVYAIEWDEEFLLAYGLDTYNKATKYDEELFIWRKLPEDIEAEITPALQAEIKEKYDAIKKLNDVSYDAKCLDNGEWLTAYQKEKKQTKSYVWKSLSRSDKNKLLVGTLQQAIKFDDPKSFTKWTKFGTSVTFTSRILKLNHEKKLGIDDKDLQNVFSAALQKPSFTVIYEFLKYKDTIKLSPAITDNINQIIKISTVDLFQQLLSLDEKMLHQDKLGLSLLDKVIQLNRFDLISMTLKMMEKLGPETYQKYIDIAAIRALAEDKQQSYSILIAAGAKIKDVKEVEVYSSTFSIKINELIRQQKLAELKEFENKHPELVKYALQKLNETQGNQLIVAAALQCDMPMMKWLVRNGAATGSNKYQQEFFDALKSGITKITPVEDTKNIPQILENYTQELLSDDPHGQIESCLLLDYFNKSKKLNLERIHELELKNPHIGKSLVSAKTQGQTFLKLSLKERNFSLFEWLTVHGATFTDALKDRLYYPENEYNFLQAWLRDCLERDDVETLKKFQPFFPNNFIDIIKSLYIDLTAVDTACISAIKFFIGLGIKSKNDYVELLHDAINEFQTPKKMCDIIEYLGDDFNLYKTFSIKWRISNNIFKCIVESDYENLNRFKQLLEPEDFKERVDEHIKIVKKEPYFNARIKEILGMEDAKPETLTSFSGTLFPSVNDNDESQEGRLNTTVKPPKPE